MKRINNSLSMKIPSIGMIKELKRYKMLKYMKIKLCKCLNKMNSNKITHFRSKNKKFNKMLMKRSF